MVRGTSKVIYSQTKQCTIKLELQMYLLDLSEFIG